MVWIEYKPAVQIDFESLVREPVDIDWGKRKRILLAQIEEWEELGWI